MAGFRFLPLSNVCPLIFVLLDVRFRINKYIALKNIFGQKISTKPQFRVTLMQLVYLHDAQPKTHLWIKHAQEKSPFINTDRAQKSIFENVRLQVHHRLHFIPCSAKFGKMF